MAGKAEPVEVFEILGRRGEPTVPDARAVERFEAAVKDFTARRF